MTSIGNVTPRRAIIACGLLAALSAPAAQANSVGVSLGLTSLTGNGSNLAFGVDLRLPLVLGLAFEAVGESGGGNLTGRAFTTFDLGLGYVGPGLFYRMPMTTGQNASYGLAAVGGIEFALPILPSLFAEAYGEYDLSGASLHAGGARAGLRLRF